MKIVTAVANNPLFIEIQYHTLKTHFHSDDGYEFIVFNDAKDFSDFSNFGDYTMRKQIENICEKLKITCINIPNEHHQYNFDVGSRIADSMNYILDYQKKNPDKYLLIDSDMFLIDHLNIEKYSEYDCAIVLQSRNNRELNYFWNGLYYFDFFKMQNTELLNWNCCRFSDTGGMTKIWLGLQTKNENLPSTEDIRWKNEAFHKDGIYFIKHLWSCTWNKSELPNNLTQKRELVDFVENDPRNNDNKYFCEIYDDVFLHYRAGSNWKKDGVDFYKELTKRLYDILVVEP